MVAVLHISIEFRHEAPIRVSVGVIRVYVSIIPQVRLWLPWVKVGQMPDNLHQSHQDKYGSSFMVKR